MVTPADVIQIFRLLSAQGLPLWIGGGWGVDALLGEQTRPHKDLDMLLLLEDVPRFQALMAGEGYHLEELWSENRWVTGPDGAPVATAFLLQDAAGRQVDAHALEFVGAGQAYPAWQMPPGFHFEKGELEGAGQIAGVKVPCLSAETQVRLHAGYALPEAHRNDLLRLCARFGLALPEGLETGSSLTARPGAPAE